jgi:hypothetical protein
MTDRHCSWRTALLLGLALVTPGIALAGPDSVWFRHSSRDCPRAEYSPLHYWAPSLYQVRACLRPSDLDQYPPGPFPPVPATFDVNKYRCRTIPPTPTSPYADPASYYGRPVAPP